MLNNFRNLRSLFWSHGSRWLLFRLAYALRKRTGYIRLQMPQYRWEHRPLETWLKKDIPSAPDAYAEWRRQNSPKFFFTPFLAERSESQTKTAVEVAWNSQKAVDEAERILSGELKYFSHTYYRTGFPPDWHKDPVTGIRLDSQKHWSGISEEGGVDIKFIWEASRFGMVFPLVRAHASTQDERYAAAFWDLVQAWAESNPPNSGPNWMDGQEAAIRLLAWTFGYHQFSDSSHATAGRLAQLTILVAAHAERIYRNIDYALSTHSNHTISEAAGLWLVGLLFPELEGSDQYLSFGRKLLEQEAAAQIFPDGTYSMYSLNYHRFILHVYLYVIRLAELNRSPLSSLILERVAASIDYLAQLVEPETGRMPIYGSNDGALVLPLNDCDFTDYRPLLQLGSYVTKKEFLFEPGPWDEDIFWLCGREPLFHDRRGVDSTDSSFPSGGTYILRGVSSKAVIRCTDYRSRPSHADQLHVDLWIRGVNIACDPGTYLYSGEGIWRNGLAHTAVHNTVTVDGLDQMKMLSRFTWTEWSRGKVIQHNANTWRGEHDGYRRLSDPVAHRRTILALPDDRWLVIDRLSAARKHHFALQWLLCDGAYEIRDQIPAYGVMLAPNGSKPSDDPIYMQLGLVEGAGNFSLVRAHAKSTRGWRSQYYGEKEPAVSIMLEADRSAAIFWTFFGLEGDIVYLDGDIMKINSQEINLPQLNK